MGFMNNKIDTSKLPKNAYSEYIQMQEKARKKKQKLEEQATLSFQKWLESEYKQKDMSGMMPWCLFCVHRTDKMDCKCDPIIREKDAMCVDAYHKMQEKLGK